MHRSAFALQLLACAAVSSAAFAQDATPPAAPAAPAAAAAPAAPAAEAPAPPPPTLPTTGDGAIITTVLTKVCIPISKGAAFEPTVKAAGFKQDSKTQDWVLPLAQKPFQIAMTEPYSNNKTICDMKVRYAPGWDQPIIDALNIWRFLQDPQLHGQRSDKMNGSDFQRVTTTWDNYENQLVDGKMVGLVLVQLNKPDGTAAINPNYDDAIVQYAVRPAMAGPGVADPKEIAAEAAAAKAAADAAAATAAAPPAPPAPPAAPATPAA